MRLEPFGLEETATAGIVNTPAPMTVPTTRPVADVRPRAWALL